MACCGFNQTIIGVDRMNNELVYWRKLLNEALNDARKLRRPYPHTSALQAAYRAVDVYWLGDERQEANWHAVCQEAYRAFTAFNQWGKK